jgi:hypothetical protein
MTKMLLFTLFLVGSLSGEIIHDSSIDKPIIDPIELDTTLTP